MTAIELAEKLNEMRKTGQIDDTTNVVYGVQSQALDIESVRVYDMKARDSSGKTKQIFRRVLLT